MSPEIDQAVFAGSDLLLQLFGRKSAKQLVGTFVSRLIGSSLLSGREHPSPLAVCRHLNRCLISSKRYDVQAQKFSRLENRSMRKSKAETAKTRERILKAASAQFLSHGITE